LATIHWTMSESASPITETRFRGVYSDGNLLLTRNAVPGNRVYGERLFNHQGTEYREWVPSRSKLSAYIKCGGSFFPFKEDSKVLYLGAASGTTSSHVADIVSRGSVFCVEISQRSFRDLVNVCETRKNMIPILADATKPDEYAFAVESPTVVYQDIAQKNQVGIFIKNMKAFNVRQGLLVIKARSEDVTKDPPEIFRETKATLLREGYKVVDLVDIDRYEKDHAMITVESK
jgi:fibrillarin-like pre-rRNA processing protein